MLTRQHGRRHLIWLIGLFAVIGIVIYSRVLLHGVFLYDDFEYVIDNPIITDFSSIHMSDPRQVGYMSFALNYAFGGENPFGYHLVNVLIHIANSVLVFAVVGSLLFVLNRFKEPPEKHRSIAFFTALLFLVHPAETQAVSYVTQRFTSLATLFYLMAVWLYLTARARMETGKPTGPAYTIYVLSFISTVLAMKTKEIAFTIPFILFLLEALVVKESRLRKRRFIYLVPFAATLVIIPLSVLGPDWGIIGRSAGIAEVTRSEKLFDLTNRQVLPYLFTQFRVIVVYFRTLLLPVNLRVIYDFPVSVTFFDLRVIASLLFLLFLVSYAVYLWRKGSMPNETPESSLSRRVFAVGIFWFFITLAVESSVMPIKDIIFEHRMYLPSVGFFMACSVPVVWLSGWLFRRSGQIVKVAVPAVLIALPLAVGTYMRNDVWTDEVKLWDDVVKKSPEKAIGYNNRGTAYAKKGEYLLALKDFDKTISLFPKEMKEKTKWENADIVPMNMSKTYLSRGDVYISLGEYERGQEDYQKAKELISIPIDVDETLTIANGFAKKGAYKHAIEEYNKILQWDPEHIRTLNDRANAYSRLGRYPEAIMDFTKIIALDPGFVLAYHNRGIAYAWSGRKEKALEDFRKACKMGFGPACKSITILSNSKPS